MPEKYVIMSALLKGGNITVVVKNVDTGVKYTMKLSAEQIAGLCKDGG